MILTRYLYIKTDVLASLTFAILDKDYEQSAFWACELYYSGFEEEVADYIMAIYREMFRSKNPRLGTFLDKMRAQWQDGAHIICTMVRNLTDQTRRYDVSAFCFHDINPFFDVKIKDPRFYISVQEADVAKYRTIEKDSTISARDVLNTACKYATRKDAMDLFQCSHRDIPRSELVSLHHQKWLYYASYSPIWKKRIEDKNGVIDHEDCCVYFRDDEDEDEDEEDEFYAEYGYEPDEQLFEIQSRFMHNISVDQVTMDEFYLMYAEDRLCL